MSSQENVLSTTMMDDAAVKCHPEYLKLIKQADELFYFSEKLKRDVKFLNDRENLLMSQLAKAKKAARLQNHYQDQTTGTDQDVQEQCRALRTENEQQRLRIIQLEKRVESVEEERNSAVANVTLVQQSLTNEEKKRSELEAEVIRLKRALGDNIRQLKQNQDRLAELMGCTGIDEEQANQSTYPPQCVDSQLGGVEREIKEPPPSPPIVTISLGTSDQKDVSPPSTETGGNLVEKTRQHANAIAANDNEKEAPATKGSRPIPMETQASDTGFKNSGEDAKRAADQVRVNTSTERSKHSKGRPESTQHQRAGRNLSKHQAQNTNSEVSQQPKTGGNPMEQTLQHVSDVAADGNGDGAPPIKRTRPTSTEINASEAALKDPREDARRAADKVPKVNTGIELSGSNRRPDGVQHQHAEQNRSKDRVQSANGSKHHVAGYDRANNTSSTTRRNEHQHAEKDRPKKQARNANGDVPQQQLRSDSSSHEGGRKRHASPHPIGHRSLRSSVRADPIGTYIVCQLRKHEVVGVLANPNPDCPTYVAIDLRPEDLKVPHTLKYKLGQTFTASRFSEHFEYGISYARLRNIAVKRGGPGSERTSPTVFIDNFFNFQKRALDAKSIDDPPPKVITGRVIHACKAHVEVDCSSLAMSARIDRDYQAYPWGVKGYREGQEVELHCSMVPPGTRIGPRFILPANSEGHTLQLDNVSRAEEPLPVVNFISPIVFSRMRLT